MKPEKPDPMAGLRYRVLIPAAERADVPWARFHTLRHACAAMLIDAGASPRRPLRHPRMRAIARPLLCVLRGLEGPR